MQYIELTVGWLANAHCETGSIISLGDISALILSVVLMVLFAISGKRIARWEGGVLLFAYALYMGLTFKIIPVPAIIPYG